MNFTVYGAVVKVDGLCRIELRVHLLSALDNHRRYVLVVHINRLSDPQRYLLWRRTGIVEVVAHDALLSRFSTETSWRDIALALRNVPGGQCDGKGDVGSRKIKEVGKELISRTFIISILLHQRR